MKNALKLLSLAAAASLLFVLTACSDKMWDEEWNKKNGEEFLAANAKKEGVVVMKSGLQYKILETGNGNRPTVYNKVRCNYKGKFVNGKQFDASAEDEPSTFKVSGLIQGFAQAVKLMHVGSKWEIYIPYALAYGSSGLGEMVPPYSALIFEVELVGIVEQEDGEEFLSENAEKEGVMVLENGLQYKILEEGNGEIPSEESTVQCYYTAKVVNGSKKFAGTTADNPATLKIADLIEGFAQALTLMPTGSKWEVYMPYALGYGSKGSESIPSYSALIYEIELLGIEAED